MEPPEEFRSGPLVPAHEVQRWLAGCGREVKVFSGCRIYPPEKVKIGDFSQIDEGVWIFAGTGVTIGKHVHMAFASSISGGGQCFIDDFVGVGAGVRLITGTEEIDGEGLTNPTIPSAFRSARRGQIKIEAHSVIFTNSIILPDVVIGQGVVVAAGSVVHHNLQPWGVYAGNPLVQVGIRPKAHVLRLASRLLGSEELS